MNQSGVGRVVFDEKTIRKRVEALAQQIRRDYIGKDIVFVCVLKRSSYFFADITRRVDLPAEAAFISIGAFPVPDSDAVTVRIMQDIDIDIAGKHIIVIDDIIRTGLTIGYLVQSLEARGPAGVTVCSLLVNPSEQLIGVPVAYRGFDVTEKWLMGYGLDVDGLWSNLPYIVEVDRTAMQKK